MSFHPRPLLAHQQRALSAAAGLVGRPRLHAGLLLTLACACGPIDGAGNDDSIGDSDTSLTAADSSTSLAPTTGDPGSTNDDPAQTSSTTSGDTLLTDASTTLTTTSGTDATTTSGTDATTSDATGTGGLDDCFLDRTTMEVDWACCEAQNWMPSPQCTPWGPPAPPVADGRLQAARRARQVLA